MSNFLVPRVEILFVITWRISARVLARVFPLPPFCFVKYTITAPVQAHVLSQAEF